MKTLEQGNVRVQVPDHLVEHFESEKGQESLKQFVEWYYN